MLCSINPSCFLHSWWHTDLLYNSSSVLSSFPLRNGFARGTRRNMTTLTFLFVTDGMHSSDCSYNPLFLLSIFSRCDTVRVVYKQKKTVLIRREKSNNHLTVEKWICEADYGAIPARSSFPLYRSQLSSCEVYNEAVVFFVTSPLLFVFHYRSVRFLTKPMITNNLIVLYSFVIPFVIHFFNVKYRWIRIACCFSSATVYLLRASRTIIWVENSPWWRHSCALVSIPDKEFSTSHDYCSRAGVNKW